MITLEQALGIKEPKKAQNITFCNRELTDIELLKPLLLKRYTQEKIAETLGYSREAINRKIAKWMQTEDFKEWVQSLWLNQYNEFSNDQDLQ